MRISILSLVVFLYGCVQTLEIGLDMASVVGGSKEGMNGYHIHCVQPRIFGAGTTTLDSYFWMTPEDAVEVNRTGHIPVFEGAYDCTAIIDPKTITEKVDKIQ